MSLAAPYTSPTNRAQYWRNINENWECLYHILRMYLPTFQKRWINGEALKVSMDEHLVELRDACNPKLVRALHAAMWNVPDENRGEWFHPCWGILVDLTTSEWCLFEERED